MRPILWDSVPFSAFLKYLPDWSPSGNATLQQHDGSVDSPNDGDYYLWVSDRSGGFSGAQLSGTSLQAGTVYSVQFAMKMDTSQRSVSVELHVGGFMDSRNYQDSDASALALPVLGGFGIGTGCGR